MARLLVSDEYPHGSDLSTILEGVRMEVLKSGHRMAHDGNPETRHLVGCVLESNRKAVGLLSKALGMVEATLGGQSLRQPAPMPVMQLGEARRHRQGF